MHDGSRTRICIPEDPSRGLSRTSSRKRGNRSRESKNSTRSLKESLRGTREVDMMEAEAASEAEAEDGVSEADAFK
jgi:hypothetical protein